MSIIVALLLLAGLFDTIVIRVLAMLSLLFLSLQRNSLYKLTEQLDFDHLRVISKTVIYYFQIFGYWIKEAIFKSNNLY